MRRYSIALFLIAAACHSDTTPPIVSGPTDVSNMVVGEVRVLTPAQNPNGLAFPGGAGATDYLVVVGNSNPSLDVVSSYLVRANLVAGDLGASSSVVSPSFARVVGEQANPQEELDGRIRAFERAHLSPMHAASSVVSALAARRSISAAAVPSAGAMITLNVPNEAGANPCTSFTVTRGLVKKVSNRAIIVLDSTAANAFTDADYTAIANEFDTMIYPTDSSYFGTPTDIDSNGHIYLYYTPQVNKLTPANQSSFIGGFFFAGDFFPPSGGGQICAESNQREIFYLLAPDPLSLFGNVRTTAKVRQGTRGTIAHEFQHMINAGNRISSGASAFESVWLDEGLAHFAEDAVGRVEDGFSDFQTLTDALIFQSGNQTSTDNYNAFFFQNLARLRGWLQRPDTSSGISSRADQNLSSRGAIWSLLRWSADNLSNSDARGFTRKLAAGPDTGLKSLTARTAQPLDSLLAGWMVAIYADHLGIPGLGSKYNFRSYNIRDVEAAIASGSYPLQVTTVVSGTNISTTSRSGSGTYYRVSLPANTSRTVMVLDPSGSSVSFPGAHFYVLRID